jgi:hypothetical protein
MDVQNMSLNILEDDLSKYADRGPAFVTFGEVMVRDTPADMQRPECTRQVYIALAGSEFTLATLLSRFGVPPLTSPAPNNPYGWLVRTLLAAMG